MLGRWAAGQPLARSETCRQSTRCPRPCSRRLARGVRGHRRDHLPSAASDACTRASSAGDRAQCPHGLARRTCTVQHMHTAERQASTATCADGAACTNQGYPILAGLARGWGGNDGNMEEEVTSHTPQCICACTLRVSVADFSRWTFRLRPSGRPSVHRLSLAQTQATPRPLQTAENRGKLASARVPCAVCWCALRTRRLRARCASQRLSPNPRRTPPLH